MKPRKLFRGPFVWIALAVAALVIGFNSMNTTGFKQVDTSVGLQFIKDGAAKTVLMIDSEQRVDVTLNSPDTEYGEKIQFFYSASRGTQVATTVAEASITDGFNDQVTNTPWYLSLLFSILPFLLIVGIFWFMMSGAQGANNKAMQFGKSKAKLYNKDMPKVTFADVAGVDEAIEELEEIKEFLKEPQKFQAVGAKIPRGVLLYGPPGTGKTLLAKAVAGEAGVPFFTISGSDFVEMFVGVGASRVRDLFEQAKLASPAIIFVDEIDAVGRHRGAGIGGGNDEREQTLNQLLVEMDGFDSKTNVILIAATNRPDVLDPALLRPGRFDRQIAVDRPDLKGREAILAVHAKNKPFSNDVKLIDYARRTPGFTGADLANVLNEAALLTAREEKKVISNSELDEAIDRVMAGPQRKSRIMSDDERRVTAYHEAGHALVAHALPHTDPVHKITIMPRGRALGYTMILPDEDRYSTTRNQLLDQLAYSLGGRAAEELIFHDPSTGASNDIEKATALARAMVTQYGMTEAIGAIKLGSNSDAPFMGRDYGHQRDYSESIAGVVDREIRKLIETAHQEAFDILVANRKILDEMVLELLDKETLNKEEVTKIFKKVKSVTARPAWTGSITRIPSDQPPVDVPERAVVTKAKKPTRSKKPTDDN